MKQIILSLKSLLNFVCVFKGSAILNHSAFAVISMSSGKIQKLVGDKLVPSENL